MAKKQKLVILLIIIIVLVLGGGLFYCWQNREIKGSPEDYIIKETEEGKFVENKKAGLEIKVPEGWEVEKIEIMEGSVILYSPDTEGYRPDKIEPPLKKGCLIEVAVAYKKTDLKEIKIEAEEAHKLLIMKSDEFEVTEVDRKPAIKNTFDCVDLGSSIDTYVVGKRMLYGVGITSALEDVERCSQEFDKFLETVSIN